MNNEDAFYIKTADGTSFGIFDLVISDNSNNEISFKFGNVDENGSTKGYENEVHTIVSDIVNTAINEYIEDEENN